MVSIEDGIVMDVILLSPAKQFTPSEVILGESTIFIIPELLLNAFFPIVSNTLGKINIPVNFVL